VVSAYRLAVGYYDAEGRPLKKMFLRAPLRFTRVTSGFSHRRFHPVLHTYRPHYGVDYGAPVGTPVMVTANGTVSFAGWDRGGGKTVKVRHPGGYTTCYLHLSRFADGIRPGKAVHQGDVIGNVGKTGLATGAHLDYRVNLNGRWINPLSLDAMPARPLAGAELASFHQSRVRLAASLAAGKVLDLPLEPDTKLARTGPSAETTGGSAGVSTARR
jgi:murein DD-endopeptidase MepM/ murein hydrolase activator NlpD